MSEDKKLKVLVALSNGHGSRVPDRLIRSLSVSRLAEYKIIFTNCDFGGATGNDRIITESMYDQDPDYRDWKPQAWGDYTRFIEAYFKYRKFVEAGGDEITNWEKKGGVQERLFAASARTSEKQTILDQIKEFISLNEGQKCVEEFLKKFGSKVDKLEIFVDKYLNSYKSLNESKQLVENGPRGQPFWFYILADFLLNTCHGDHSELSKLWQEMNLIYPNMELKLYGNEAHNLEYKATKENGETITLPNEERVDNRLADAKLIVSSGKYTNKDGNRIEKDPIAKLWMDDCDIVIVPPGSADTTIPFYETFSDEMSKKMKLLIVNSGMNENQTEEYLEMIRLFFQDPTKNTFLMTPETMQELKLDNHEYPQIAVDSVPGPDGKKFFDTQILTRKVMKIFKELALLNENEVKEKMWKRLPLLLQAHLAEIQRLPENKEYKLAPYKVH